VLAVAPIVGRVRVASATGNIVTALGVAIEIAEEEAEHEESQIAEEDADRGV
jgi:hypothetical protein